MDFRRNGSFRQRARHAEITTWQLQEHRKKRVAERTHEQIQQFEENLKTQLEAAAIDDLPIDAEAGHLLHHSLRRNQLAQHRDNASDASSARERAVLLRTQSEAMHTRTSGPDVDSRYARRPPSPLGIYNYGSISLRPRSVIAQRSKKTGESCRPKHRQGTPGFYFPGAEFRQGIYGFSMLDPIHMNSQPWAASREPPVRWEGGPGDLRPVTTEARPGTRPSRADAAVASANVRSSNAHSLRGKAVFQALDKQDEESHAEQVCFEHTIYEGNAPSRAVEEFRKFTAEQRSPKNHYDWLELDLESMNEHQRLATRILFGLEAARRSNRGKVSHLFRPVNRGTPGILEPDQFLEGLLRLGIIQAGELKMHDVIEAMMVIDAEFDGCINFRALDLAISAARAVQKHRAEVTALLQQQHQAKISTSYSESLPVDVVKVDRQSRSLFDFERAFEKFRKQQRALLEHHGEVPH